MRLLSDIRNVSGEVMQQLSLPDLIVQPAVIWTIVGCLIAWTASCGWPYHRGITAVRRSFGRATSRLDRIENAQSFVEEFEELSGVLREDRVIGPHWREYRETLILPSKSRSVINSTVPASDFFNLDILRSPAVGLDSRFHAALPGLLVGLGLLFTFLGLAIALSTASGIVQGDASQRNDALKGLLDAASFKFVTSIFGLLLSVAYSIFQKSDLRRAEKAIDVFVSRLDELMPPIAAVAVQVEATQLLEEQQATLQAFSNDLAVSIGKAMDTSFNQRLGEHIEPLTIAITRLAEGLAVGNQGAIDQMLSGFVDRLQGGAGAQVNAVAENLSGLGRHLGDLQASFSEAAARMTSSADAMTSRMSDGAAALQSRIDTQAEAAVARMSGHIEAMVVELRELASHSRNTGQEALGAVASEIATAARGFEASAARVAAELQNAASSTGGALGKGAEEAVDRIASATEGMRRELSAIMTEMRTTLGETGQSFRETGAQSGHLLREGVEAAGTTLAAAVASAADRLTRAGSSAGDAIAQGGGLASEQMGVAGRLLNDGAVGLGREVATLTRTADSVGKRFEELDRATAHVIEPLVAAASDLKTSSTLAREAVEPLTATSEAASRSLDQVGATAARLETAATQAVALTISLDTAVKRFEGVDEALAATLMELQNGLRGFTSEVSGFVTKTDANLAKAASQLLTFVKALEEQIEELNDTRRAG